MLYSSSAISPSDPRLRSRKLKMEEIWLPRRVDKERDRKGWGTWRLEEEGERVGGEERVGDRVRVWKDRRGMMMMMMMTLMAA